MIMALNSLRLIVASVAFLALTGCIGLLPSPFRPSPGPTKTPDFNDLSQAFDVVCRNYRLGPDDTLRVIYQTEWTIAPGSYQLDTLDEIDIEFILDPALNRKVSIRPDGMITLPGVGDILAAGLTPEALAKRIGDKYLETKIFTKGEARGELKNYKMVTVNVVSFYQKVKKLVESLTTLTGGQQMQITVNPDGTIDLPLLHERIMAVGHTVREVESTINERYTLGPLKHVVASLSLSQAQSRKVYVLGEVQKPGAYDLKQPITPLQAIALAGGPISEFADLTSVMLMSKDVNGKPIGRRLDLKKTLDVGDMASAILVKPYDVIFVPKTYIADVQLFMKQYVGTVAQIGSLVNVLTNPTLTLTGF